MDVELQPRLQNCMTVPEPGPTEDYGAIRAAALAASHHRISGPTPRDINNIVRWRAENPNAVTRWRTTYGTCVAWGGMVVYYGTCPDCSGLVHTRRPRGYEQIGNSGRWPKLCDRCRAAKSEQHANNARHRMAALRKRRYEHRAAQFAKAGLPPVRQGVRMDGASHHHRCPSCGDVDCICGYDED